jgi:hypothetical protein
MHRGGGRGNARASPLGTPLPVGLHYFFSAKNWILSRDPVPLSLYFAQVLYLQQELAKQQTLEQQRFKQALEKQRLETQMAASEKVT